MQNAANNPVVPVHGTNSSVRGDDNRTKSATFNALNAIMLVDDQGVIISADQAACSLFGYSSESEIVDSPATAVLSKLQAHSDRGAAPVDDNFDINGLCGQIYLLQVDDTSDAGAAQAVPVEVAVSCSDIAGRRYQVVTLRDMTSAREYERRLQDSLYRDQLTGLPNKDAMQNCLEDILGDAATSSNRYLLLEIGIDQMRMINTTYGMESGNALIQKVGARLSQALSRDVVSSMVFFARGSADRFQALVELPENCETIELFGDLAKIIADAMLMPFEERDVRVAISLTTGGVEIPLLATDPSHAVRYADMALYEAKISSRGDAYLLIAEDVARVHELSSMVHKIRSALQKQEFFPVFQPKIDLESGRCASAECLIRWRTEAGEMIPPGVFIPIAESVDLIEGIGRFIFLESCAALKEWAGETALRDVKLAVNLSPKQLERDNFIDFVKNTLEVFEIPPSSLEFEITETTLANNPNVTFARVRELTAMGVSVSIDDFGTGQSSLGMLRDVGATRAKVDRAFLQGVPEDYRANRLLSNIINLMRDMNLPVTVEGIETEEVAAFVRTLRCSEGQGYFFAKPMEKGDFEEFVREKAASH